MRSGVGVISDASESARNYCATSAWSERI